MRFETARMTFRQMILADVDDLLGIFSDPEAMRFYPGTKDRAETEGWVRWNLNLYEKYGHGLWIASLKGTGEFAGQCGLLVQEVEGRREIEIGYLFLRRLWGRGLATEAAQACRDRAIGHFGYRRLISLIDPGNIASRRVAEKNGMHLEKIIEKWNKRLCLYSMEEDNRRASGPGSTLADSASVRAVMGKTPHTRYVCGHPRRLGGRESAGDGDPEGS